MTNKVRWMCPKCGATPNGHGKGGAESCDSRTHECGGFVCECENGEDNEQGHGDTAETPCHNANCYHCGWGGTFPPSAVDPRKLKGWARTAWSAGWRPPIGWTP